MHRSPKELIELYWTEVWNNRNVELIRELCADPIVRHDPGSVTALSVDDQIARVRQQSEHAAPFFEHEVLHADDRFVTSVWNMHTRKGPRVELCGIEVFEAKDGKFIRCWNSSYTPGRWGRDGDKSVPDDLAPPALIAGPEGVTADWLQAVFQHAGLDAPRISLVSSQPIGHGNLSRTVRTQITYNANAARAVTSVICKLTSGIPQALDIAQAYGVYAREASVYEVFGEAPPLNAPHCFLAQSSPDGRAVNLVLEDLSARARLGDQIEGCSQADARAVVAEFAKLHRAFWGDPRLAEAPWLYNRSSLADTAGHAYAQGAAIVRQRFAGRLESRVLDAVDAFTPHVGAWTRTHASVRRTLIHGEPRVDNVLFEDTPVGPKAWLIDWQFADLGSPMFDTAYFLAGSLTQADRKACERALIAEQQGEIAKSDPSYTLDIALAEYADALPFALFTTTGAALALPEGEHTDRLLMTLLSRNVDALADWDRIPG
ncbi:MAG: phosphotransferase [Alphaproteobacteria bacterium]|nr:phosphotransferase [Alphaproteobacteria bacterium]